MNFKYNVAAFSGIIQAHGKLHKDWDTVVPDLNGLAVRLEAGTINTVHLVDLMNPLNSREFASKEAIEDYLTKKQANIF